MQSRIPPKEPPYAASIQDRLDRLTPPGTTPLLLFRVMARDERLAQRFFGASLLDPGHLALREREIVVLRTCARHGSEYEWGVHVTAFAGTAKLSDAEVNATLTGEPPSPTWTDREMLLLRLADELADGTRIGELFWRELKAEFSDEALLELLLLTGFYRTISMITNALDLDLEEWAARFPQGTSAARQAHAMAR